LKGFIADGSDLLDALEGVHVGLAIDDEAPGQLGGIGARAQ